MESHNESILAETNGLMKQPNVGITLKISQV